MSRDEISYTKVKHLSDTREVGLFIHTSPAPKKSEKPEKYLYTAMFAIQHYDDCVIVHNIFTKVKYPAESFNHILYIYLSIEFIYRPFKVTTQKRSQPRPGQKGRS